MSDIFFVPSNIPMSNFEFITYEVLQASFQPNVPLIDQVEVRFKTRFMPAHEGRFCRNDLIDRLQKREAFFCHGQKLHLVEVAGQIYIRTDTHPIPADEMIVHGS